MEVLQTPLNKAQLELLKLFSKITSEEELMELKTIIGQYYANKATQGADQLWKERGYTQETMNEWLSEKNKHANRS